MHSAPLRVAAALLVSLLKPGGASTARAEAVPGRDVPVRLASASLALVAVCFG